MKRACHALSIDDPRLAFEPVLWRGQDDRIDQVWFAGVHSNVGGGYIKQGMSLVALDWILAHAEYAGLRVQKLDRDLFRGHASVDDLMYDPRAGIGLFYRWGPRDIASYCRKSGIEPRIHLSVAERIAHATDDYAPGNVPPEVKVVFTPLDPDDPDRDYKELLLERRAAAVGAAMNTAFAGGYKLHDVRLAVALGQLSYAIFLIGWATLAAAIAGILVAIINSPRPPDVVVAAGAMLVAGGAFVLASLLARRADQQIEDEFSAFWQKHQRDLRGALKHAKDTAKRGVADLPPEADRISRVNGILPDNSIGLMKRDLAGVKVQNPGDGDTIRHN